MITPAFGHWVIYHRPINHPGVEYMARLWTAKGEAGEVHPYPTETTIVDGLQELRDRFEEKGLVCISRSIEDDPVIVEVWL